MFSESIFFGKQYYFWRLCEWEREIKNGYPLLRLVKEDSMIQIMEGLADDKKMTMAKALIKRGSNPEYLKKIIGEIQTEEENKYIDYFIQESRRLRFIYVSKKSLEDYNYHVKIEKKKFKQYIIEALSPILGNDIKNRGGGEFSFCTPVGVWKIYTRLDIGASHFNLCYDHSIKSENREDIANRISLLGWLGIMGQTQWQYLSNEDLKPTAESLAILCEHFMAAVPKLLEGIPSE